MSSHSKAAAKFIADAPRTAWHDKALFAVRTKRDKMMHEVPEWEALREEMCIRDRLSDLPSRRPPDQS